MKHFAWDPEKNAKLERERGLGFEAVVFHIERGEVLDILEHPNKEKTIIPSRKATRTYLRS